MSSPIRHTINNYILVTKEKKALIEYKHIARFKRKQKEMCCPCCCCRCFQRRAGKCAGILGLLGTILMGVGLVFDEIWYQKLCILGSCVDTLKCGWNTIYTSANGTQNYSDDSDYDQEAQAGLFWLIFSAVSLIMGFIASTISLKHSFMRKSKCLALMLFIGAILCGVVAFFFAYGGTDYEKKDSSGDPINMCSWYGGDGKSLYVQYGAIGVFLLSLFIASCYKNQRINDEESQIVQVQPQTQTITAV